MFSELLPLRQKVLGLKPVGLRALAVLCLLSLCSALCPTAQAGLTGLKVEQVRAQMPQLRIYCDGCDKTDLEDIEAQAYLDGEALTYAGAYDCGQEGTDYIFLLDVSGSIKKADFNAAKEQILTFYQSLNSKDGFALVTFGDDVDLVFQGAAGSSDFESTLATLNAADSQTHLYEAISSGVAYAQAQDVSRRQIMIVVSDGIQATGNVDVTRADVERELERASLPVYSICTQSTSRAEQEEFSTFAHQTGGEFYIFQSTDAGQVWQQLTDDIGKCGVLVFEGESNLVDGESHTLMLKYRDGTVSESVTKQVTLTQWQPDEICPQVENILYLTDTGTLVLTFSEKVTGAGDVSSYRFVSGSKEFAAESVAESGENTYTVTLPHELPSGEFSLEIVGVTDRSMEKNPLDYEPVRYKKPVDMRKVWLWVAAAAGVVLLVVLVAVVLRRRKKPDEQVISYRVEHVNAPRPQQSLEPSAVTDDAAQLTIGLVSRGRVEQVRTLRFTSSSIWGRGDEMCDLCVSDDRISHQHCALELSGGTMSIRDLGSKNGTYVNGVRLTQLCPLKQGDSVQIGDTTIKILDLSLGCNVQNDHTMLI